MSYRSARARRSLALATTVVSAVLSCAAVQSATADQPQEPDQEVATDTASQSNEAANRAIDRLGPPRTGGGYIDDKERAVVTVTGSGISASVGSDGITTRGVDPSLQELRHLKSALDRYGRRHGAGQVQEWHI